MSYFDNHEERITSIHKKYRRDRDTMQKTLAVLERIERQKPVNEEVDMLIRDCGLVIVLLNRELKDLEGV